MSAEKIRLKEDKECSKHWKKWGPYLTERQWGTVREDYSPDGMAWENVSHDDALSINVVKHVVQNSKASGTAADRSCSTQRHTLIQCIKL